MRRCFLVADDNRSIKHRKETSCLKKCQTASQLITGKKTHLTALFHPDSTLSMLLKFLSSLFLCLFIIIIVILGKTSVIWLIDRTNHAPLPSPPHLKGAQMG